MAADAAHCREVLDACERLVERRPELEVLSARQRLFGSQDEDVDAGDAEISGS